MLGLAFIAAYVFGREYSEATAKNLLTLPVARHWFVFAKLIVILVWWVALVMIVLAEAFLIGIALDLPGYSTSMAAAGVQDALLAAGISYLLVPVLAWITTLARSDSAPIAFAIGMMALGNLFGRTGWAVWFPWSIVPLLIGMMGDPLQSLPPGSYVVLGVTFVAGIAATIAQLRYTDITQ